MVPEPHFSFFPYFFFEALVPRVLFYKRVWIEWYLCTFLCVKFDRVASRAFIAFVPFENSSKCKQTSFD